MFNLSKKKTIGHTTMLKVNGMHCTSCSADIDLTLEEIDGVSNSDTNYAKALTSVTYDEKKTNLDTIKRTIEELGYQVIESKGF